jgi:fumarate reductase flavoprotein subunit
VILASGGIGFNKELLMRQGWTNNELSRMSVICCPTIEGDGYKLAQSAGAKDFLPHSCDQVFNRVEAYSEISTLGLHEGGPVLWVNQDALRFGNEAMYWINLGAQHAAAKGNRDSYVIYDQSILDSFITDDETAEKVADVLNADNDDLIYSSNSIEDLASHFNLDVNTLVETVAAYNKSCSAGRDNFIGKDPQFMIAIENPPYYIARISYMFVAIDGATYTNIRKEVLDSDLNTIPGLYAVGLDGAMLWRTIYTQDIPGTLMGHNVNSGRVAANSAKVYIESIA